MDFTESERGICSLVFFRRRVRRDVLQTPYRLRTMSQMSMMQP